MFARTRGSKKRRHDAITNTGWTAKNLGSAMSPKYISMLREWFPDSVIAPLLEYVRGEYRFQKRKIMVMNRRMARYCCHPILPVIRLKKTLSSWLHVQPDGTTQPFVPPFTLNALNQVFVNGTMVRGLLSTSIKYSYNYTQYKDTVLIYDWNFIAQINTSNCTGELFDYHGEHGPFIKRVDYIDGVIHIITCALAGPSTVAKNNNYYYLKLEDPSLLADPPWENAIDLWISIDCTYLVNIQFFSHYLYYAMHNGAYIVDLRSKDMWAKPLDDEDYKPLVGYFLANGSFFRTNSEYGELWV